MATTDKINYQNTTGIPTSITCTFNSLAASATVGRQATPISNSATLYQDVHLQIKVSTNTGSNSSAPSAVLVYISSSSDGSLFDGDDAALGASDAGYTINSPSNLKLAMVVNCPTKNVVYYDSCSLASLFGFVPYSWCPVVINNTGQTLAASGNLLQFTGIYTNNG
jgi:uncharacterized membrane protein YjjB (DUF3815 family)